MKKRYCIFIIMQVFLLMLAACGSREEAYAPLPTMASANTPAATVTPAPMHTPVPTHTPVPMVTPIPTSTPTATCTPVPTSTPISTQVPEDYGDDIFVFDREYTDEWGEVKVCFWLKDKDGNPIPNELCEATVYGTATIKSPSVVDYYCHIQSIETDEEGKAEFLVLRNSRGDEVVDLFIKSYSGSGITKKINFVDPVKTVPSAPEIAVEQREDHVIISWTPNWGEAVDYYYVERRINNGEYEIIEQRSPWSWESMDRDYEVKYGNVYYYRVFGKNYLGEGERSEEICVSYKMPNAEEQGTLDATEITEFDILTVTQKAEDFFKQTTREEGKEKAALKTVLFLSEIDGVEEVWFSDEGATLCFEAEDGSQGRISID